LKKKWNGRTVKGNVPVAIYVRYVDALKKKNPGDYGLRSVNGIRQDNKIVYCIGIADYDTQYIRQ